MELRKNINRGYMQLRVWQDARELYLLTWDCIKTFPYELKRIASQQIASVDSIHRNIAEGYCRRGIKEYLQHKQANNEWDDSFIVKESNELYTTKTD